MEVRHHISRASARPPDIHFRRVVIKHLKSMELCTGSAEARNNLQWSDQTESMRFTSLEVRSRRVYISAASFLCYKHDTDEVWSDLPSWWQRKARR